MNCNVCGCEEFRAERVSDTFRCEDRVYIVENIPADVCTRCGEPVFEATVAEQVRRLINGPHQPTRVINAEVLSFRAA
jgi:HTH-type transcriptional regulator / antitoxin MqsA